VSDLAESSDLKFDGLVNFRDVGGLPLSSGGRVRRGLLYRSESLQEISELDADRILDEHGVRAILDLRSSRETVDEGRGVLGRRALTYVNAPLNPAPVGLDQDPGWPAGELTAHVYRAFLDDPEGELPRALGMLPVLLQTPTLVHCAAGKDRTGLVIAMTLEIAGVEREAVLADYVRSSHANDLVNEMLFRSPRYLAHSRKVNPEFYEVHPHAMRRFLDVVDEEYGGVRGWAVERGVSQGYLDDIASALRED
jgi:protein-tyrosine phosphatase